MHAMQRLVLVTLNCPEVGQPITVDGEACEVREVQSFTGTVAVLSVAPR